MTRGTLALLLALATGAAVEARVRGHVEADSGGTVRHIQINDEGIQITDERDARHGGTRVRVVRGPVVVVDEGGTDMVRLFSDAEVPEGKRVLGDVVSVFGSVTVAGEVSGDVVSVFGSVILKPTAVVDGDAVSVGGALRQDPGARIEGQSVSLGMFPITWGLPALPVMLITVFVGWMVTVFVGWLFSLIFPERMVRVAATASRRTAASFFLGLLSMPMFLVLLVLLFVTLIGIPLGILLPLIYAVVIYLGQIAATYLLGCKLARRRLGENGLLLPLVAGSLVVAAFFVVAAVMAVSPDVARMVALFFILLGVLLIVGLSTIGTGAFLLSRAGSQPRDLVLGPAAGGAAPAVPVPPAPASPPA
jgi:hypothetical protein